MIRSTRRTAAALLAALVSAATLWLVPAEAATPAATYQNQAFAATNHHRANHHLVTLRRQHCVQTFAVRQARRMARQHRMFHQHLGPILRQCGLSRVGENVAYGYPTGRSVVNDGWMHSPGHRANILDRRYRVMGIGARKSGGRWYVSQVFGRPA
jgi:uncharacterized protein YkwD